MTEEKIVMVTGVFLKVYGENTKDNYIFERGRIKEQKVRSAYYISLELKKMTSLPCDTLCKYNT